MKDKEQLKGEIRYAIRLTQRTARLYRRIQTAGVFFSIIGGSATMASISGSMPEWASMAGGVILTVSAAMLVAIRPADKAAQNEYDAKRYQSLMARSEEMDCAALEKAIEEAHGSDCQEIEPLRAVAYNDIASEMNREDVEIPLSPIQKILKSIA